MQKVVERVFDEVDTQLAPVLDKSGRRRARLLVSRALALIGPGGIVAKHTVALGNHAVRRRLVLAGKKREQRGRKRIRVAALAGFATRRKAAFRR